MTNEQIKAAREALDSMDDYARMESGVDAAGPRGVLVAFIDLAERVTPTAAVAEGTIDPHDLNKFWDLVIAYAKGSGKEGVALEAHYLAAITAASQKAREEAEARAKKAEEALEEWRFTNRIDEMEREVNRLREQHTAGGDAYIEKVIVFLNHLEDVLDDENFGKIDRAQWSELVEPRRHYGQPVPEAVAQVDASGDTLADYDRILRSSVPEHWKACTSPIGAAQSYIAELEQNLSLHDPDWQEKLGYDGPRNPHGLPEGELRTTPAPVSAAEPCADPAGCNAHGCCNPNGRCEEAAPVSVHPDDLAVDRFAAAMKTKMAASRAKGWGGWDDPAQCRIETLAAMLCDHVQKGDPVDIGNFAMMIHQRGGTAIDVYEALAVWQNRQPAPVSAEPQDERVMRSLIEDAVANHKSPEGYIKLCLKYFNDGTLARASLPSAGAPAAHDPPIEYRYTGGTTWCDLGPAEHMKMDFDGAYRIKAGKYPTWQGDAGAPVSAEPQDERAAFEKEANDARFFPREIDFSRRPSPSGRDEYSNGHLQSRWEGWQARASLPSTGAPVSGAEQAREHRRIDEALVVFLAEHTRLNQDGIDTHAVRMALDLNSAALRPVPDADIAEWREQGYLADVQEMPEHPDHPRHRMTWSVAEQAVITKYGQDCARAALATAMRQQQGDDDGAKWREILAAVVLEMPKRLQEKNGNAPGHGHSKPGIWDGDNGALAGKECAWCKTWNLAVSALAAKQAGKDAP